MSTSSTPPDAPDRQAEDATPVRILALRDVAIVLVILSLWAAADAWRAATGLASAAGLSLLDGIAAGYVLARMAHEWGHFAGARWAGGLAPTLPVTTIGSVFTFFTFDLERSPPRAFRAMGVGGNVGHWAMALLLLSLAPLDTLGRIALPSAAVGFALSASLTEIPFIRNAFSGASAQESFRGFTRAKLARNRWIGAGAGLLMLVLLS